MFQAYLVRSGDGTEFTFGYPRKTLALIEDQIRALDAEYKRWENAGFPELPDRSPLAHYEGSDIYAVDEFGEHWGWSDDDGWEPVCVHRWEEQPGEPPWDVCRDCGAVRH